MQKTKTKKKQKNMTLKFGTQIYQVLTNDDEVCIPSLFNIRLPLQHQLIMNTTIARNSYVLAISYFFYHGIVLASRVLSRQLRLATYLF